MLEIANHQNLDLRNIVTPVKVKIFERMLKQSGFNADKTKFLVDGFTKGFSLQYQGPKKVQRTAPNLKLRVGSKLELWNKVMVEVKAKRYAGPFKKIPFKYYIQSPVGLVPKDQGKKTRLIFHLSYPKDGDSVNSGIPDDLCTVKYPDFMDAVELCFLEGQGCFCAKSDMSMAFRNVAMDKRSWCYLILKAEHPVSGQVYYFVDKCLPFGASISCAIFQAFSDAVGHLVSFITKKPLVNYLDDYFFAALTKSLCDGQVTAFLDICKAICFPVSLEKTYWGTRLLTFLGLLIDTVNQLICIPVDKLEEARELIGYFIDKSHKKATVSQIQQLSGFLNFLCKCVVPGRAFTRRLYSLTSGNDKLQPHHHVRISAECRMDLEIWMRFLEQPMIFCRPFIDCFEKTAEDIDMYSDASGAILKGFGAYCGNKWTCMQWDYDWFEKCNPSIEYLELYAVTVVVLLWINKFKNSRILLHCDNESVCKMIKNSSTSCRNCMILIRIIVLEGLLHNVNISAEWVATGDNGKADALSRLEFQRFRRLGPDMEHAPTCLPDQIWPISKIWQY